MPKVTKHVIDIGRHDENPPYEFQSRVIEAWRWFCEGCGFYHEFWMDGRWSFDGNEEAPSFKPSLVLAKEAGWEHRCHTIVTGGMIEFLTDCSHALAGQTVPLLDVKDWPESGRRH